MTESSCKISTGLLESFYESMVRIRRFEEVVADFVEAGEIKTPCHFCIGQEAVSAGVCGALTKEDYIWGAHRSHGHYLAKGGNVPALMAEIFCRQTGCSGGRGGSMHICAPEVGLLGTVPIVAGTIPIAVGAGFAAALGKTSRVSVSFFGDGATEEGHFHESLNLAGVNKLPVIFVCENNFYSSHLGLFERRLRDNITDSAVAHGIPSERLDGNDVEAVHAAACRAVSRARAGDGPTLLECRTFRWRGHVGAAWDIDVGVKRKDELQAWLDRDPIKRTAQALLERAVSSDRLQAIQDRIETELREAVEFAQRSPHPQQQSFKKHVFWAA